MLITQLLYQRRILIQYKNRMFVFCSNAYFCLCINVIISMLNTKFSANSVDMPTVEDFYMRVKVEEKA